MLTGRLTALCLYNVALDGKFTTAINASLPSLRRLHLIDATEHEDQRLFNRYLADSSDMCHLRHFALTRQALLITSITDLQTSVPSAQDKCTRARHVFAVQRSKILNA